MSQELFNTAFRKGQFGYASAMGVVLAIVTLLFAAIVFVVNRLTGGGERRRAPMTAVATDAEHRHRANRSVTDAAVTRPSRPPRTRS